jgi:hypothetical protein
MSFSFPHHIGGVAYVLKSLCLLQFKQVDDNDKLNMTMGSMIAQLTRVAGGAVTDGHATAWTAADSADVNYGRAAQVW